MEQTSYNSKSVVIRPIGNLVLNNDTKVCRRKAPATHTAKKVTVQLDRQSYVNRTRTNEMPRSIMAWSFPDSGAQICLISPSMVSAMGGSGFITAASLQIKDAGHRILTTEGLILIVITCKGRITGLEKWTHQMAYMSQELKI